MKHIEKPLRFWRSWQRRLQPRSVPFRQIEPDDQQLLVFDDFWNHFSHFSETILLVVVPQELWDIITNREESLRQTWQDAKIPVGPQSQYKDDQRCNLRQWRCKNHQKSRISEFYSQRTRQKLRSALKQWMPVQVWWASASATASINITRGFTHTVAT